MSTFGDENTITECEYSDSYYDRLDGHFGCDYDTEMNCYYTGCTDDSHEFWYADEYGYCVYEICTYPSGCLADECYVYSIDTFGDYISVDCSEEYFTWYGGDDWFGDDWYGDDYEYSGEGISIGMPDLGLPNFPDGYTLPMLGVALLLDASAW